MDTSEVFTKMCAKATEIQALRPRPDDENPYTPKQFDRDYVSHFYLPKEKRVEILKWDNDEKHPIIGGYNDDEEGAIWLPHQDQLQEMVYPHPNWNPDAIHECYQKPLSLLAWIYEFAYYRDNHTQKPEIIKLLNNYDASMEQLWLAFVMKEKYNKVWNGEDWVKS